MMNKSQFGWCDFSWNPVTGCKIQCDFCYGRKLASRLCGTVRLNLGSPLLQCDWKNRLFALEKPFHNLQQILCTRRHMGKERIHP